MEGARLRGVRAGTWGCYKGVQTYDWARLRALATAARTDKVGAVAPVGVGGGGMVGAVVGERLDVHAHG